MRRAHIDAHGWMMLHMPQPACGRNASFYNDALSFKNRKAARPVSMIRTSRFAVGLLLCAELAAGADARKHKAPQAAKVLPTRVTTIAVNAYLWRAALDTLSFASIAQTDSNGGVLVTNWYVNPQVPSERMKVSVSILDQDLRADAVRVAAARQVLQNGQWIDTSVQAATNQKLEEIILQKARDLRRNTAS